MYCLFVLACARQTTPTGGPKDSIPPTLINSVPKHGQVNFKGKTIELTFSETIILNNPKEQLIITPNVGKDVDIAAKKNQVIITLEEDLKDSTTYSFNFREAVQDITEKNPAEMLKLAFSTGHYIDSLSISGNVYDLLRNKEMKNITVALYETDTFNIFQHSPTYISKTDNKGNFILENLKPGRYFIYGFDDKNKNLVVDSKTESYGFLREAQQLKENLKDIKIPLINLDARALKLTSARPYGTYFNIKTTKNLTTFKIKTEEDETIISSFGEDQTNVKVYNTFENKDSVSIKLIAEDSIRNAIDTTLYVKFGKREARPENFELTLENFQVVATKGLITGQINFTKPVLSFNYDSIFFRIDSTQTIPFANENITWDSLHNHLFLRKSFDKNLLPTGNAQSSETRKTSTPVRSSKKAKTSLENQFYLGKSAFISIELDSSKRVSETIAPSKIEDTGVLMVEVETKAEHFIVQILSKDFNVLHSKQNSKKMNFEDLKPGDYQIRLVIDSNNNGKWDPGNFYSREEPEQIEFYKNEKNLSIVNLKANWELGPLLIKH